MWTGESGHGNTDTEMQTWKCGLRNMDKLMRLWDTIVLG